MNKVISPCANGKEVSSAQISLDEAMVIDCVNKTIIAVSEKIQGEELLEEHYADTVKALAALVEARAKLL